MEAFNVSDALVDVLEGKTKSRVDRLAPAIEFRPAVPSLSCLSFLSNVSMSPLSGRPVPNQRIQERSGRFTAQENRIDFDGVEKVLTKEL